jgi:carboxyl-terminal processing protease
VPNALCLVRPLFGALLIAMVIAPFACSQRPIEANPERYSGIGVELTMEAAGARVVRVIQGGAAEEAGLRADDVVLEVAGHPARGKTLAHVVERLRGPPGSTVKLLARTGEGNRALTVTRRTIDNR